MSKSKYQSGQYMDQLMLPPGSDASKPTKGYLVISLTFVRLASSQSNSHLVGRFRMWGQSSNRYVELGKQITYDIKCRNTTFLQYLSDMKALNFQLVDKRNQELFGTASVSLLTHLNKNISMPNDSALLPIDTVYQITKNPSKAIKAEIGLKIETIFSNGVQMPTFAAREQYPMTDVKLTSVQSLIRQRPPPTYQSPMKIEEEPIISQPTMVEGIKQLEHIPKKKPSLPIIQVKSPTIKAGQLDAELLRLKLQAESLLSPVSQPIDYPKTLTVEVLKVNCPKWEDISLEISYPKLVIDGIYSTQHVHVTATSKNKADFTVSAKFIIEDWQEMLHKVVSFSITNNKYQHLNISTDFTIKTILESKQLQLVKNNKSVGFVEIRTQLSKTVKQQPKIQDSKPHSPTFSPPANALINICIRRCLFFDNRSPDSLYKVTFKLMKQNYQTQSAMLSWNYNLICPIFTSPQEILCFQLWRSGDRHTLEGVSKVRLEGLTTLLKQGINPVNIGAVVLKDGNMTLNSIQNQRELGYLQIKISVGNVRQMQWEQQKKQETRDKPPRQQKPYIRHQQSNPPSSSNRVESERRLETKQTDSKAIEVDEGELINLQDINIAQTLTRFFQMLSEMPAKTTLFIKNLGENETLDRDNFRKILTLSLGEQQEQLLLVLSIFFSLEQPSSQVNISEFMKCFSSYANFIQILMEQRSALLLRALHDLEKNCTLDVIEQKLSRYSQFGLISRQKFQDVMQQYMEQKLSILLTNSLCQTDTIDISAFVTDLKNVKFGRKPQHIDVKTSTFQQLIKQSVEDVLGSEEISIGQLLQNVTNKDLTAKSVAQLLQKLKIQISYWQGLLLIQTIKSTYRQDLSAPSGIISNETFIGWIQGVVDSNAAANKSIEAQKLNKTISKSSFQESKARSKHSQAADDIHQIADLLKFKDRYDYTQSISKSKELNMIAENQSKYSNVLPAQSNMKASKKQSIDHEVVEIRRPDPVLRLLRCQIIELRSQFQGSFIVTLEIVNSYSILLSMKDGKPKFYSSNAIYEEIDLSDILRYSKMGVRGINVSISQDGRNICRGLIPLQDIFQLDTDNQNNIKKACALYPRSANKIVLSLALVKKKKETATLQKQNIFFRIIKATKKNAETIDGTVSIAIDHQNQHKNVSIYDQHVVRPSENLYSSKLTLCFNNLYWASMTLQGLITSDDYRAEIPLVDDSQAYYGKLELILSKNPITIKNTQNEQIKIMKLRLFIFVENVICLRPKKKKMDVYWSIYIRGKEVCRSTTIEIDINGMIHCQNTSGIHLNCQLTSSQPLFQLRMMSAITNETYAISRLAINPTIDTDHINFSTNAYCLAENRDKFQMRFQLTLVSILADDSVRLDNIVRIFRKDSRKAIRKILGNDDLNEKNMKDILHDKNNLTYSEIAYLSQAISIDSFKEAFRNLETLSKSQCLELLAEFQFSDPDATGFVSQEQLDKILKIFNLKEQKQSFLVDMLTKNRISVDYLRYLQYEIEASHVDSSFKQINSEIDRLHETISRRLKKQKN